MCNIGNFHPGESNHILFKRRRQNFRTLRLKVSRRAAGETALRQVNSQSAFFNSIIQTATSLSAHPFQPSIINFTEPGSVYLENAPVHFPDLKGRCP